MTRRGPTLEDWFAGRGWRPFPFQEEVWSAWREGVSGLLHAPTGMGKTLALWGGALQEALAAAPGGAGSPPGDGPPGLRYLWITPLRALARDTASQLEAPARELGLSWTVELRTGDTPSSRKSRQRTRPPTALVTTPESLSVLLSWPEAGELLAGVEGVMVDEWHELLSTKRGVQLELALARLRRWNPGLRVWGLSATLGNPDQAMEALLGDGFRGRLVRGPERPLPVLETLLPEDPGRFPWSGHLGLRLLPRVMEALEAGGTSLLFTNTRSQAELWHDALAAARPEWAQRGELALHHGSLDREERESVEEGLRGGRLRCVVCTSSLDLGVDFPAVDRVFQVGSPKGVGRLLQRAGRSGHTPGGASRITCVPGHAFELVEFAATRRALAQGRMEPRTPLEAPLDVLAQHLVTVALGGGFRPDALLEEIRTTRAYRGLPDEEWGWVLEFVTRGGAALQAYPRYRKVEAGPDGVHRVPDAGIGKQHRMTIGTITADPHLTVRYLKGRTLGTVEESFVSRLRPGDTFLFAGRRLRLVRIREMTAWVRRASGGKGSVPRWMGGRMPLSNELGEAVLEVLDQWEGTGPLPPEVTAVIPLLELQARWSRIPGPGTLLVERTPSREGEHLFVYPFLGRRVHEGLGALLAYRLAKDSPRSVQFSVNDYGLELVSPQRLDPVGGWKALLSPEALLDELPQALNAAELARRHFREVARVAGLIFPGYPGRGKSARQLQASAGLLFDVLERYDPGNLLLVQARREVLERDLGVRELRAGLQGLLGRTVVEVEAPRLTPLAFPFCGEARRPPPPSGSRRSPRSLPRGGHAEKATVHPPGEVPGPDAAPSPPEVPQEDAGPLRNHPQHRGFRGGLRPHVDEGDRLCRRPVPIAGGGALRGDRRDPLHPGPGSGFGRLRPGSTRQGAPPRSTLLHPPCGGVVPPAPGPQGRDGGGGSTGEGAQGRLHAWGPGRTLRRPVPGQQERASAPQEEQGHHRSGGGLPRDVPPLGSAPGTGGGIPGYMDVAASTAAKADAVAVLVVEGEAGPAGWAAGGDAERLRPTIGTPGIGHGGSSPGPVGPPSPGRGRRWGKHLFIVG